MRGTARRKLLRAASGVLPAYNGCRTQRQAPNWPANPGQCGIDNPLPTRTIHPPVQEMSTAEQKQQTPTPAQIPFTDPQAWVRFVTDTGKILPRKYTGLCAKHQRAVTRTIKHSRNMLLTK
jgi:small subunit ribosomal protein S18